MRRVRAPNEDENMHTTTSAAAARLAALLLGTALAGITAHAETTDPAASRPAAAPTPPKGTDHSGRRRVGIASVYANRFAGRKMADGRRMDPHDHNAASKTLPIGTEAKVTNLETGQSAHVVIEDRGPYVKGRIVDLSPATAERIGITRKQGVAKVEVAPVAVPMPDGTVKPGAAAEETGR
jgi:rare lipoprotein A